MQPLAAKSTSNKQLTWRQTESSTSKKLSALLKTTIIMLLRSQVTPKHKICTLRRTIRTRPSRFWSICRRPRLGRFWPNLKMITKEWLNRFKWCKKDWYCWTRNLFSSSRKDLPQRPSTPAMNSSNRWLTLLITQPTTPSSTRRTRQLTQVKFNNRTISQRAATSYQTSTAKTSRSPIFRTTPAPPRNHTTLSSRNRIEWVLLNNSKRITH